MRTPLLFLLLTLPLVAEESKTSKLTPSPETTYLTEPLLPDGRIDYVAALNQRLAAQTTPENNLLVGVFSLIPGETEAAIMRAFQYGKDEKTKINQPQRTFRERFCELIGLDAPPPMESLVSIAPTDCIATASSQDFQQGLRQFFSEEEITAYIEKKRAEEKEYFQNRFDKGTMTKEAYEEAIKRVETETPDWYYTNMVEDQWQETMERPWTAKKFPYIAKWLESTGGLTEKLIALSKERTGYYHPWLTYDEDYTMLQEGLLPFAQSIRNVSRFFEVRGNHDFTEGNLDRAFECAFSSIRMGQTVRRGSGCIVEDLIGLAMTGMGDAQLTMYLAELPKDIKSEWILQKKKEFDALRMNIDFRASAPQWCLSERLATLSFIQLLTANPKKAAAGLWWDEVDGKKAGFAQYDKLFLSGTEYDWNEIARRVNHYYDDWEDIYTLPNWQRRFQAMKRLAQRAEEAGERSIDSNDTPEQRAAGFIAATYIPVYDAIMYALARGEWEQEITNIGFALAAYRADNSAYPDKLAQLVPKYMDSVPNSPHTDKPMRYIKRTNDVLITSDDKYKLDGSEAEIEKMITEARSGGRVMPATGCLIFVVTKF